MAEFTKVIPASCLRGSGLLLTPEFRDAVVPETGTYTLQNAEGKQTTCTITRKAQGAHERCDIHGGWRQFARDNDIKEGDEVRIRHLGGRVIEIAKTGRTGTPSRTPAKAKTPGRPRGSGAGSKTPGTAEGGVGKRRGSGSAKKAKPAAAAGDARPPAGPSSGRRGRRSSQGAAAARAAASAAPPEDDWQEQQEQAAGSSAWCAIM